MTGPPTYLKVWIWHWSRHFFNKSVTQSYIDHSSYHESKWNKIIFWLAPTLYQLQCSNCLYCKICLLCRLTYKGIVCHPLSPPTGYLHSTCVSKESASWYFVVLLSKLHPPFLNLNFIHFWKYSVTNLTGPIRPLELHFAIHVSGTKPSVGEQGIHWEKTKNLYRHMNDQLQRAYLTSNLSDLESVARLAKLVVEVAWVQPEPVMLQKTLQRFL